MTASWKREMEEIEKIFLRRDGFDLFDLVEQSTATATRRNASIGCWPMRDIGGGSQCPQFH
jgi:hypothetical protein